MPKWVCIKDVYVVHTHTTEAARLLGPTTAVMRLNWVSFWGSRSVTGFR